MDITLFIDNLTNILLSYRVLIIGKAACGKTVLMKKIIEGVQKDYKNVIYLEDLIKATEYNDETKTFLFIDEIRKYNEKNDISQILNLKKNRLLCTAQEINDSDYTYFDYILELEKYNNLREKKPLL